MHKRIVNVSTIKMFIYILLEKDSFWFCYYILYYHKWFWLSFNFHIVQVACTSLSNNEVLIFDIGYVSSEPSEVWILFYVLLVWQCSFSLQVSC